jgi:hypothetical protein
VAGTVHKVRHTRNTWLVQYTRSVIRETRGWYNKQGPSYEKHVAGTVHKVRHTRNTWLVQYARSVIRETCGWYNKQDPLYEEHFAGTINKVRYTRNTWLVQYTRSVIRETRSWYNTQGPLYEKHVAGTIHKVRYTRNTCKLRLLSEAQRSLLNIIKSLRSVKKLLIWRCNGLEICEVVICFRAVRSDLRKLKGAPGGGGNKGVNSQCWRP